ncbi:MAG: glycosyltransferase family 61 protein [Intrasporangium sp.]|uniref:glycosyltransferase family 61 protein n=1 Tax=Intrasporangium sp. TaxID=1925024 RepID=UPI002647009F|nr:glycosyltransferase family 61 protein [Intrasporangium sp.]MDN5794469.1 glycosyltransferase family 61 protein [Intrasporangium sp.]
MSRETRMAVLDRLLLHLSHGGRYVIPRHACPSTEDYASLAADVIRMGAVGLGLPGSEPQSPREGALARCVGEVAVGVDHLALTKVGTHYLRVVEADASRTLASRSRRSRVQDIVRLPAQAFTALGKTTSHGVSHSVAGIEPTFEVPAMTLRRYEGDITLVGSCLALLESSVMPESFRHNHESTLRNPRLVAVDREFATVSDRDIATRHLPGSYYHLDASNSGHFGHLTTEVVSKLWGWDEAKSRCPDLKAFFRLRHPNERIPELEMRLFQAYGIDRRDVVWAGEPVRVDELYGASPLWHNQFPHFVSPRIVEIWDRMAGHLVRHQAEDPERVFVSRHDTTSSNRRCRNRHDVESYFEGRGFTVIYPEHLDLVEQATIFAGAKVVAGFAGSALFNLMYSRRLEKAIVLAHEGYTARNEHLYGAVLGFDVDYVWSSPDIAHPEGGWTEAAYFSDWEFDFRRNKKTLEALVP